MKFPTTALLAAIVTPLTAVAQIDAPATGDTALETLVVTGSYAPLPQGALTSSISILDRDTLQALNKRNLADVLRTVAGVWVEEQGGPGGLTAVSIRGGEANFTLVLLDGVPINDPTNSRGGSVDLTNLDLASVARIEVVRGPQSAVYGSDALAGVINIITDSGETGHSQSLSGQWGGDDYQDLSVSASGQVEGFRYALSLARRDSGDAVEGSSRDVDNARIKLDWQLSERQRLGVNYQFLEGERSAYPEQSGGPDFARSDARDISEFEDQTLALNWQLKLSQAWSSELLASRFDHQEDYLSPGIVPFYAVPPNAASTDYQRDQLRWVNTLAFGDKTQVNVGADYRSEEGESIGYLDLGFALVPTDFAMDRSSRGVFVDVHSQLMDDLVVQGSLRYDDPDDFDSETSLKLGASYQLNSQLQLFANWGEAYKLPSFFALGHALVGNPDLQAETAESWDLGGSWSASETVELAVTYFSSTFKNLVDFDAEEFRNVNRSEVDSSGVELQLGWQPVEALSLQAQATYTDLDLKGESGVLTGRPQWTAGAMALWQLAPNWNTALDWRWTDEQFATSLHSGESELHTLDDYHRLDWNLRHQFGTSIELELAVDNLLDEDYQTAVGFPAAGRAVRVGVRFSH